MSQMYLKETAFKDLMQKRIFNVLLIASPYDAFMMEEDGRVEEQLYFEYTALNLSSPPRVDQVHCTSQALEAVNAKPYDLIIIMPGNDVSETLQGARQIKQHVPDVPIVMLTPFSKEVSRRLRKENLEAVDYVFSWLGNVDLLLAIIKLLEDKMNAPEDINGVGVQMILLVEDSVRFYSSALPLVYKFLLRQSRVFSTEALNEHEQMLRMRGRPKVMLARDYNEAMSLYATYGPHILGVITDVSYPIDGKKDPLAGVKLSRELKKHDPYLPIILESSEAVNEKYVAEFGGSFLDKNSKKYPVDLGDAIMDNFGFGDFVVRNPETGEVIKRISSLKEMQNYILQIPSEALYWHASFNDISRWLYSRALFPIAEVVKKHRFRSLSDAPKVRQLFFDLIVRYRKMKNRGVVAIFQKDRFDHYSNFARIGQGSLGGKGRGLAFVDHIIKKNPICDDFQGLVITTPRTVVLCTDVFDEFMASNRLYPIALSPASNDDILARFQKGRLPEKVVDDLRALLDVVEKPFAVRSSSLLEDSHYQPFAGIYSTYMIPQLHDKQAMLSLLCQAVKSVYASVFFADSKAYMAATSNVIDQEKMAVIIQEVVGRDIGPYYLPTFSGVGRSLNFYPLGPERPEDGVVEMAVGLGKYIVDGGQGLRFSPKHPGHALQTSEVKLALRDSQTILYALETRDQSVPKILADDSFNLKRLPVGDPVLAQPLRYALSTYDANDQVLRDTPTGTGRKVVTFNAMLKHQAIPVAQALAFMLETGQREMARPVEIEFAGVVDPEGKVAPRLYWLQIRPIVDRRELVDPEVLALPDSRVIVKSNHALGNGNVEAVKTIVYVKPQDFSSLKTPQIAQEIEGINRQLTSSDTYYVLIGPGRWGSSDPALGIPVKWPHISGAKVIVESSLPGFRVEPSQGTHFFQNLTSLGVSYLTIDPPAGDGFYDIAFLDGCPAFTETDYVRVVQFPDPMPIAISGIKSIGVVAKPDISPILPS